MPAALSSIAKAPPIVVLVATVAICLVPAPAIADFDSDAKACLSREVEPKERVAACEKVLASETINQKQRLIALYAMGHSQLALSDFEQAVLTFGRALELAPDEISIVVSRSQAYVKLRRFNAAIADLTRAIELKPKVAALHSNRGNAYAELGDHHRALKDFDESIRIEPSKRAQPYIGRGRSLIATGAHQKAIEDFTKRSRSVTQIWL